MSKYERDPLRGKGCVLTPSDIGRVFAGLDTEEQAQFWDGVAAATQQWPDNRGYSCGEVQWCYLRDSLLEPQHSEGFAALQSLSAWVLLHAWNELDTRGRKP